jgi:hypothetical protein
MLKSMKRLQNLLMATALAAMGVLSASSARTVETLPIESESDNDSPPPRSSRRISNPGNGQSDGGVTPEIGKGVTANASAGYATAAPAVVIRIDRPSFQMVEPLDRSDDLRDTCRVPAYQRVGRFVVSGRRAAGPEPDDYQAVFHVPGAGEPVAVRSGD